MEKSIMDQSEIQSLVKFNDDRAKLDKKLNLKTIIGFSEFVITTKKHRTAVNLFDYQKIETILDIQIKNQEKNENLAVWLKFLRHLVTEKLINRVDFTYFVIISKNDEKNIFDCVFDAIEFIEFIENIDN